MTPDIEIYIDRLILHDHDVKSGRLIGEALEQQLTSLLLEQGLPLHITQSMNTDHIQAGSVSTRQRPAETGQQIATNIYRHLSGSTGESKNVKS